MSDNKKYKSSYYNIDESRQFRFIRTPYDLVHDEKFKKLSIHAKFLYGLLLDKMGLCKERNWYDKDTGRAYIIYKTEDAMNDLCCSNTSCAKYFNELEDFALIERVKRGNGLASIIYVKNFNSVQEVVDEDENKVEELADNSQWSNFLTNGGEKSSCPLVNNFDHDNSGQNIDSRDEKSSSPEVKNIHVHNIDIYQTILSDYNNLSHSFNNKHNYKDSSDLEIDELNERMKARENDRSIADQFDYDPYEYHLTDDHFKELYKLLYEGNTLNAKGTDVKNFINDLIIFDDLNKSAKQGYGKAIVEIIKEIFTSKAKTINITKDKQVDRVEFTRKLLLLDHATIREILVDLNKRKSFDAVKYPKNYLMSVLWDAHINQGSALRLKYSGVDDKINPDNKRMF